MTRYGMTIDIDKCTGCGACMVACAVENNVPPAGAEATDRKGITWIRVYKVDNGEEYPGKRSAFVPVLCQQCGHDTPCAHVCPQQAVDVDPATGIVGQMPERCLGCRYCMAACPYHARYFNWWDPEWPAGMEKTLNPDVAPRMRGVVEKCNFCHGRLACCQGAGRGGREARDRSGGLRAGVRGGLPGRGDPVRRPERPGPAGGQGSEQLPAARKAGHRTQDLLPLQARLGARNRQRAASRRRASVDKEFIARGVKRCSTAKFLLWILPWAALLAFGLYAAGLCLVKGLNQTNMDNRFAFGLWIFLDLTVIALGAGAFFTGFLLYILKLKELHAVINSAVVIGLVCYSGAVAVLAVDVGQPLRAWFTFWYPNVHSMLTEVTFCITCYLTVLAIEYLPIVLKNRKLREMPSLSGVRVRAAQADVCAGRRGHVPFVLPPGVARRAVRSAARAAVRVPRGAGDLAVDLLPVHPFGRGGGAQLHPADDVAGGEDLEEAAGDVRKCCELLGRISGLLLVVYVLAKTVDTLVWINRTSPESGFPAAQYYSWRPFGTWILFAEIVAFGLVPALILLTPAPARPTAAGWSRRRPWPAAAWRLNRFVMTVQTLAVPTLSFDQFLSYWPSWQEIGTFLAVVAYGVLVYSFSFRYFQLFPEERELKIAVKQEEEEPALAGRY